jgi:carbon monoxide dehydrogenase subunit G
MAETEYATSARLPIETIWDFVQDMDNWAAFVQGYQRHEKQSETESQWVLKGDVGVLARTLQFKVLITEWSGPERVTFQLEGVNEPMKGEGSFTLERYEEAGPAAAEPSPRKGFFARLAQRIARFAYRLFRGRVERGAAAGAGPGAGMARMTFRVRLDPAGPMAPMINAMIKPMLLPAAEDLANRILATLEARRDAGA